MASYPAPVPREDSGAGIKLLALFLGIVVVVMGTIGLWLALSAQHARDDANAAARSAGPAIHVRVGQTVKVTLVNQSPMPHSVDFHAARIAPNVAFSDVMPGASKTFTFKATDPGVFMYHCGTAPAFMHIANGMVGAIVV